MDNSPRTNIEDEESSNAGYYEWVRDTASDALSLAGSYLGFSSQTQEKMTTTDTSKSNPEACQATGKSVCCCNKNKPK